MSGQYPTYIALHEVVLCMRVLHDPFPKSRYELHQYHIISLILVNTLHTVFMLIKRMIQSNTRNSILRIYGGSNFSHYLILG